MKTWTEDDTYLALRRVPWREVFIKCLDGVTLGESAATRRPEIVKAAGWTAEDFEARVLEAILKEGLQMDITIITDREWQQKFLAGEV